MRISENLLFLVMHTQEYWIWLTILKSKIYFLYMMIWQEFSLLRYRILFLITCNQHKYPTRRATRYTVNIPKVNTTIYGLRSIKFQSAHVWNLFVNKFPDENLKHKSRNICKKIITKYLLSTYIWPNVQ